MSVFIKYEQFNI